MPNLRRMIPSAAILFVSGYFGREFASINSSQFSVDENTKEAIFKSIVDERTGSFKIVMFMIPLFSYIYEDVYRTTTNWLNHKPMDTLGSFTLDNIITDLVFPPRSHAIKGSKKRKWFSSQPTSKSQMMWPTTFYKLNLDRVTNGYHTLKSKLKQKTS